MAWLVEQIVPSWNSIETKNRTLEGGAEKERVCVSALIGGWPCGVWRSEQAQPAVGDVSRRVVTST